MRKKGNRNSMPGKYCGFSEVKYENLHVESRYIEGFDGTKLAMDIIRPADVDGIPVKGKFPVLMLVTRGERFQVPENRKHSGMDIIERCVPYGYVGCVLESRGCGASYGVNDSFCGVENRKDVTAALDWIAQQEWCDGNAAMFGGSNRGFIQFVSAVSKPAPSRILKAITPVVANADVYYQNYPNGVSALPQAGLHQHLYDNAVALRPMTKEEVLAKVVPVDEDVAGDMAYEAYLKDQFPHNHGFMNWLVYPNMCRDEENVNFSGEKTNLTLSPMTEIDIFKASSIKVQQFAGSIESGTFGQLVASKEWGGGILIGPWDHRESRTGSKSFPEGEFDFCAEHHKWFDSVLKHIDNGFDEKPPYMYYVMNAAPGAHWRCSDTFPLETVRPMTLYLNMKRADSCNSVNDGTLGQIKEEKQRMTEYKVDTSIRVFDNGEGETLDRMRLWWDGDMTIGVDEKGLTFTSAPVFHVGETEINGVTSVDLWVTCSQNDADFFAYLEEIKADGTSHYIAHGCIRASHRTSVPRAAWDELGATYHPCMKADMERCLKEGMAEPVHLQFHIEPVFYVLSKGSRIRVTITCADSMTYQHPMYDETNLPVIHLYQGGDKASFVRIPFVEHTENTYNGKVTFGEYQGPGTLYFFEKHTYLYYDGRWKKYDSDSEEMKYEVKDGIAHFRAGFAFQLEGRPILDGILQDYQGDNRVETIFPSIRYRKVAVVPRVKVEDTLYAPDVLTLYMDVYCAADGNKKAPCVAFIHGYSRKPGFLRTPQLELIQNGYTVIGIELRSSPGNYYPDYIKDLKGEIRYIRAHAVEFGIDPDRIASYGQSLGGNAALVLGITSSEEDLEGDIGGNIEYSSRIQAMVVGYGWSDALYMGQDLLEEYKDAPTKEKWSHFAGAGGPFAPLAYVTGFAGPGKGMDVLRAYLEDGREGSDPYLDFWLEKAREASPVNHIAPDCCPAALYGGLGMNSVNIPCRQSMRTFEACSKYGIDCFAYLNTNGEYGQKEEVRKAILGFLDSRLKEKPETKKTVIVPGKKCVVEDYVDRKLEYTAAVKNEGRIVLSAEYLKERYGLSFDNGIYLDGMFYVEPDRLMDSGIQYLYYPDKNMVVLSLKEAGL